MGDYGAAVSQKGYDVKTCDDRFLVYSSAFPVLKIFSSQAVTTTLPRDDYPIFTADASTDYITSTSHGLLNGDLIHVETTGTLPGGLVDGTDYYVINKTTSTFQVSLTSGGSAVNITSIGTGTHDFYVVSRRITITHDLGYYAPFLIIYNGSTSIGVDKSYFMSDSIFGVMGYGRASQYTDKLVIDIDPSWDRYGGTNTGDTLYFTIYIFLDDFTTVDEKNINTGTSSGSSSTDYGIRISKAGFDVLTCDDKDCILSSSFFTNIIHKKGIADTTTAMDKTFTAAVDDTITCASHGLINGNRIQVWSEGTLPGGLVESTTYFVVQKTTNTFKVSLTLAGSPVNITSTGTGVHWFYTEADPISHNLGYVPAFLSYARYDSDSFIYYVQAQISTTELSNSTSWENYYYIILKQKNNG